MPRPIASTSPAGLPAGLPPGPHYALATEADKAPRQLDGSFARVNDPSTLVDLRTAVGAVQDGLFPFLGIVLTSDAGLVCADLDHCIDDAGRLSPLAASVLAATESYAEASRSGTGIHALVRARMEGSGMRSAGLEVYSAGRFIILTGRVLGDHLQIVPDQKLVDGLVATARAMRGRQAPQATGAVSSHGRSGSPSGPFHRYDWGRDGRIPLRPAYYPAREGERHNVLVSELGRAWALGCTPERLLAIALAANEAAVPPRSEPEVLADARSIMRYPR